MTKHWIRSSGIFGVLGGIILFAGDMLFYYDAESTNFLKNMAYAADNRIALSGVSALIAAWFYILGLGQVYYAFKPSKPLLRNMMLVSLGGILIAYGVIHGAFVAIATSAKLAIENGLDLKESVRLASDINDILRLFVYPLFAICSLIFIFQVWKKKTFYPRWMILFFPLIPFLIKDVLGELLSGKWWTIIMGGYLNLILIVFFTASTIALWNVKKTR
ncbi:DUF6796 family protein [Sungkyunkwania multivorans]|uniref:DUF6796 family protein n=1 Tax=Sungkyunkwania multivorans TaxID=1173618 RepID=A0ABW3D529_9FLAO